MTDFPNVAYLPLHVSTISQYGPALTVRSVNGGAAASALTWVANQAAYIPMSIPWAYPVKRVFWMNGTSVGSNVDFGIYTPSGNKIYSTGSTAQSGTSVPQYVTPATPFVLPPGTYYFAINCDGTTARLTGMALTTAAQGALSGFLTQAVGAIALPATATFATYASPGYAFCGITRTASGY